MARSIPDLATLPRYGDGDFVYALRISDGTVKVGRSHTVRNRFILHAAALKRRGLRVTHFAIERPTGGICETERELCERLGRLGSRQPETREWFRGIPWGVARNLLRQIASRQIVVLRTGRF